MRSSTQPNVDQTFQREQAPAPFSDRTLCYATNDNQDSVYKLLTYPADLTIVTGGYNSMNTTHLVELCQEKLPTYYINSAQQILTDALVRHVDPRTREEVMTAFH